MGTAGFYPIRARFDQASNASPGHSFLGDKIDEFDAITGNPALHENDAAVRKPADAVASGRQAGHAKRTGVVRHSGVRPIDRFRL